MAHTKVESDISHDPPKASEQPQENGSTIHDDVYSALQVDWRSLKLRDKRNYKDLPNHQFINWSTYFQNKLLTEKSSLLLTRFGREPLHTQAAFASQDPQAFSEAALGVLKNIVEQKAVFYVLIVLDDMLREAEGLASAFSYFLHTNFDPFIVLSNVLEREWGKMTLLDETIDVKDMIPAKACFILCHLLNAGLAPNELAVKKVTATLKRKLDPENKSLMHYSRLACVSVFQSLLRQSGNRLLCYEAGICDIFYPYLEQHDSANSGHQMTYQMLQCIWLLSYSDAVRGYLVDDMQLVKTLAHLMRGKTMEKILRMVFAICINLSADSDFKNRLSMFGVEAALEEMLTYEWMDEEVQEDVNFLKNELAANEVSSSTFDEYCKEVLSSKLDWTPRHKSAAFWEQNTHRFLEKDGFIIKELVNILGRSDASSRELAVAIHDVSELLGRSSATRSKVMETDAKELLMLHLLAEDEEVKTQALQCVQRLMLLG